MRESCIMCLTVNRARRGCADRDFRPRNVADYTKFLFCIVHWQELATNKQESCINGV